MFFKKQSKTKKSIFNWLMIGLVGFSLFLFAVPAFAQTLGLEYGTATGLGTQDLRVSVMNIIRAILGFLGVLAIIIVAYGGFVWMTAGGNAQRIDTAKSILRNALIGLVIIFASFMIVSFIIGQLSDATGADDGTGGGFTCTANACTTTCGVRCNATGDGTVLDTSCNLNCGGGTTACPKPTTVTPTICSIEARDGFGPGGVPQGAVGDFITIQGWYFGDYDSASSNVTFDGTTALIVECSATPSWTNRDDDYGFVRVEIPNVAIDATNPYDVVVNGTNGATSASPYLVNSDNSGLPQLACINPALGKNDDTLTNAEGRDFGATSGQLNFTFNESASFSAWSDTEITSPVVPSFAMSGPVQVETSAGDLSNQVWFTVVCADSLECGSGCCSNNQCAHPSACFEASEIPRINYVSPGDGAVGNFITVGGDNFGTTPGVVEFFDGSSFVTASLADTVNGACSDSVWTSTEVVVVVPAGAADGPIRLTRGDNGLADQTNDSYGPAVPDFIVNGIVRPGICGISPTSGEAGSTVSIYGVNFNSSSEVYFGPEVSTSTLAITASQIDNAGVPTASPGILGVRVLNGAEFSNSKNFEVIGEDGDGGGPDLDDFNCSADTQAPSCVVGDDSICNSVFGTSGLDYTCNPTSCRCEITSSSDNKASAYTWFFGTTSQGPQVVESCTRTSSCGLGTHTSPSPFDREGSNDAGYRVSFARPNDGPIPVDAIVTGMFNTKMFESSLNTDTINVYECNSASDDFDPGSCATTELAGTLDIRECNYLDFASTDAHCFDFTPSGNLTQNTWYKVELNADQIFGQNGVNLIGNFGVINEFYNWAFKTRDSDELSRVACLYVDPSATISRSFGDQKTWTASASAQDFLCVNMNISNADSCDWSPTSWTSSDTSRAPLSDYVVTDPDTGLTTTVLNKKVSTALAETALGTPVEITASCDLTSPTATVSGSGFLTIDFSKPVVVDRFPNCGTACTNALVGMTFSKTMKVDTVLNSTKLYICYNDPSCQTKVEVTGFNIPNDATGVLDDETTFLGTVPGFDDNGDGEIDYYLLPDSYYQVVIEGKGTNAARSDEDGDQTTTEGDTLGGLNFDNDNDPSGILDSYAWTFKTKPNFDLCLPGSIEVNPRNYNAPYDTIVPYEANPLSAPDFCSPTGQRLIQYSWGWEWDSSDTDIATLVNNGEIVACGNGVVELGEDCDLGINNDAAGLCDPVTCLHTGNNAATCGNGVIDSGEECEGSNYCSGCLLIGNTNTGAVCGNGIIEDIELCEGPGFIGCDTQCLLTGSVPGASRCGNGIIEVGEECDEGELAFGDSPSNGDYNGDGIECSAICKVQNRTTSFCRSDITNKFDFTASCGGACDPGSTCVALDTAIGNSTLAPFPICGNGLLEVGEQCDPGPVSVAYCSSDCLNAGSYYETLGKVGPYQLALTDADTTTIGFTEITANVEGDDVTGTAILSLGNSCIGELMVVEGYPSCGSACANAVAGARFCNEVSTATLTTDSIHLLECADQNCSAFIEVPLSNSNIIPYDSSCERAVVDGDPVSGCTSTFIDAFRIELPSNYNPTLSSVTGSFLPDTTYRVVIENGSGGVLGSDGTTQLTGLNYDFDGNNSVDSYSWSFTTRATSELCRLGGVEVLPNDIILGQDVVQGYYFQSRARPDSCDPLYGQRINPWFYDWRAESILLSTEDPSLNDDSAAFFLATEPDILRDGCGNLHIEEGEDCDDGNLDDFDGCSAECLWEGDSGVCPNGDFCNTTDPAACGGIVTDCSSSCGNSVIDYGEACDDGSIYCNSSCLLTGSGTDAVCGDGILDIPGGEECDVGNEPNNNDADGCTNFCTLAGGVPGVSYLCGNGIVDEEGEQCDSGFLTGINSDPSCTTPSTDLGCDDNISQAECGTDLACFWTGTSCITRACLINPYPSTLGNNNYNASLCGNGIIEAGEQCDGGSGCDTSCLNIGSIGTDGKMDPYQVLQTQVVDSSLLTRVNEEIRAWTDLDPNVVGIAQLTVQLGSTLDFRVIGHQPPDDPSGTSPQCRNAAVGINFSSQVDLTGILDNVKLCEGDCATGPSIITSLTHQNIQGTCVVPDPELEPNVKLCDWGEFADDPANQIHGSCNLDTDCIGSRLVVNDVAGGFLQASTNYQIEVVDTLVDLAGSSLDCDPSGPNFCTWSFSTNNDFCECDFVGVSINPTSGDSLTTKDLFTCAGDACGSATLTKVDDDAADNSPTTEQAQFGNQHIYTASCFDVNNPQGQRIELLGNSIEYQWQEFDPDSLIFLSDLGTCSSASTGGTAGNYCDDDAQCPGGICQLRDNLTYVTPGDSFTDTYGLNGLSEVKVSAKQYACADTGQLCSPVSLNCSSPELCQPVEAAHRFVEITNFICENPWPDLDNGGIFRDSAGAPVVVTCSGSGFCPITNFELFYCQDAGEPGTADDLNSLIDPRVISVIAGRSGTGVLKDFIIPVCDGSEECQNSFSTLSDSALGIRVLQNPLHLSPRTWYESGLCGGVPDIDNICFSNAECGANNILGNPGFEEVGTGTAICSSSTPGSVDQVWSCGGSGTLTYGNSSAQSGSIGANVPASGELATNGDLILDPGSYIVSAFVKSNGRVKFNAEINGGTNDHICTNSNCDIGTPSQSGVCSSGTGDWEQVTCTFNLTNTTNVSFVVDPLTNAADIDNVELIANSCQFNVPVRGNPQDINVGNYQGLREGRSVYVSAANRSGGDLYSNIYLLSYDEGSDPVAGQIVNRILDPLQQDGAWNFNVDFTNHRVCGTGLYQGTNDICSALDLGTANTSLCKGLNQTDCSEASGVGCYWSPEVNGCLARVCEPIYCESNFDCPALNCNADREEITRDAIRYGDLRDVQISLENYNDREGRYPVLGGGSYIETTSFSIWPSWQQTFASTLGTGLPVDPLNRFTGCGEFYCDTNGNGVIDFDEEFGANSCSLVDISRCGGNYDSCIPLDPDEQTTCWDEASQEFSCPVDGGFNYAYRSENNGQGYNLYTVFELDEPATWRTAPDIDLYDLPVQNVAGGGVCEFENFEIKDATIGGTGVAASCTFQACYGGTNDPEVHSCNTISDCPDQGPGTICSGDADQDGVCDLAFTDNCSPSEFCKQNPRDCYNPDQLDANGDGVGNICDTTCSGDADSDGVCDEADFCPTVFDPFQEDSDGDLIGNACDPCTDIDHDGWWDVDTGANDPLICGADNCSPRMPGKCVLSDGSLTAEKCLTAASCSVAGSTCFIPFGGSGVSDDRNEYCHNGSEVLPIVCTADAPAPGTVCPKGENCCPTAGQTCEQLDGSTDKYYNPFQEDFDNDLTGYICDACIDFDNDQYGDYTFYTGSLNPVLAQSLTEDQEQHFSGCQPALNVYSGFTAATGLYDLDNCPAGPNGAVCKDKFGGNISCSNPGVSSWIDVNGVVHTDGSQQDSNLNNLGDICDPTTGQAQNCVFGVNQLNGECKKMSIVFANDTSNSMGPINTAGTVNFPPFEVDIFGTGVVEQNSKNPVFMWRIRHLQHALTGLPLSNISDPFAGTQAGNEPFDYDPPYNLAQVDGAIDRLYDGVPDLGIGLVGFSNIISPVDCSGSLCLQGNKPAIETPIANYYISATNEQLSGGTNIHGALEESFQMLLDENTSEDVKIAILSTDGIPTGTDPVTGAYTLTVNGTTNAYSLDQVKSQLGITIYVIAITDGATGLLNSGAIASGPELDCVPDDFCYTGSNIYAFFDDIVDDLTAEEICNNLIDDNGDGLADCLDPVCVGQTGFGGVVCCDPALGDNACGGAACQQCNTQTQICEPINFANDHPTCSGACSLCLFGSCVSRDIGDGVECGPNNACQIDGSGSLACLPVTVSLEICGDGADNDGDGQADCRDTDCAGQIGPGGAICCQNDNNCGATCSQCDTGSNVCIGVTVDEDTSPDPANNCVGECTRCVAGSCVLRDFGDGIECSAGLACGNLDASGDRSCDLTVGTSTIYYPDTDGDDFFSIVQSSCLSSDPSCPPGVLGADYQLVSGFDCNDGDGGINPSATDNCGNGIDENCDGFDASCTGCGNGICDGSETSATCPIDCGPVVSNQCSDSDFTASDPIPSYSELGQVTVSSGGSVVSQTPDLCDPDGITLIEQYCLDAETRSSETVNCTDPAVGGLGWVCESGTGRCKAPAVSCDDTDGDVGGANNFSVKGTVTGADAGGGFLPKTDVCDPVTGFLTEYGCVGDNWVENEGVDCADQFGSGWSCSDGACIPPIDSCEESGDTGVEITVQGSVAGFLGGTSYSEIDTCASGTVLEEWSCSGSQAVLTTPLINCDAALSGATVAGSSGQCLVGEGRCVELITYYPNIDGDTDSSGNGYYDENPSVCIAGEDCPSCAENGSCLTPGLDCDDDNAAINPDAVEICADTIDNDCDGDIDGADSECALIEYYPDADGDLHFSDTVMTCDPGTPGDCPPCALAGSCITVGDDCRDDIAGAYGQLQPNPNALNSDTACDNIDWECDGAVDDDFNNTPIGPGDPAWDPNICGFGICGDTNAALTCVAGEIQLACTPDTGAATAEICDAGNLDEDCDGSVNEDCTGECGLGDTTSCSDLGELGICGAQTAGCLTDGSWDRDACDVAVTEDNAALTCTDAVDNDCDGNIDCQDSGCSAASCGGNCVTATCDPTTFQWSCAADASVDCGGCGICDEVGGGGTVFSCQLDSSVSCGPAGSCDLCQVSGGGFECLPDHSICGIGGFCDPTGTCQTCDDSDGDFICDTLDLCPHTPSFVPGDNTTNNADEEQEFDDWCQTGCFGEVIIPSVGAAFNGGICEEGVNTNLIVETCLGADEGVCSQGNSCKVIFGGAEYMNLYVNGVYLAGNLGLSHPESSSDPAPSFNPRSRLLNFKIGSPAPIYTSFMSGPSVPQSDQVFRFGAGQQNIIAFEVFSTNTGSFGVMGAFTDLNETGLCSNLPSSMIKRTERNSTGGDNGGMPERCFVIKDDVNTVPSPDWKTKIWKDTPEYFAELASNPSFNNFYDPVADVGVNWENTALGIGAPTEFNSTLFVTKYDRPKIVWLENGNFVSSGHAYCQYVFTN